MTEKLNKILLLLNKYTGIIFLFCCFSVAIGFGFGDTLKTIEVFGIDGYYKLAEQHCSFYIDACIKYKWLFVICAVLISMLNFKMTFYRKKVIVIEHKSFAHNLAGISSSFMKNYKVDKMSLDQKDEFTDGVPNITAVEHIDKFAEEVDSKRKGKLLGYYGIAHTPLIFRLGFKIGDFNNMIFLHKKRNNDSLFEELKNDESKIEIKMTEENSSVCSDEMIVAISTSFLIKKEELKTLGMQDKHIVSFESNCLRFDSLTNYTEIEYVRNEILSNIRKLVKNYNIRKIHLAISSSCVFTFFLGQSFSAQHDPEIIVYHYHNGAYPWGICINKTADESIISVDDKDA